MVVQSVQSNVYKDKLFQSKNIERKNKVKIWVM